MRFQAVPLAIFARVTASSTSPAVGSPVQLVRVPLAGVPNAGVTSVGEVALTSPPEPVEVAPQRVSTIAPTVVSSRTVLAAAVIVAVCGTPVEAVVLPMNWSCARLAILASVTAPSTIHAVGSPVAFVRVRDDGVPPAPLNVTNAPADHTATARAVATPVPGVIPAQVVRSASYA
jgi:hypothetical protein